MKINIIISVFLIILIPCLLFGEIDFLDTRIIYLLNNLDLEKEFDFPFLLNYTKDDLTILLNVSFAKHGRPFKSRKIRDIFQNTKWYNVNPYYTDSMLTATDKVNAAKIYAILSLSSENETLLYKIKRAKQFLSDGYPAKGIRISIDNDNNDFIIDGKINDIDNPWQNQTGNKNIINKKISIPVYGADGWFIYNNVFYFFIEEIVETEMYTSHKIRSYFSCVLDYNKKMLYDMSLVTAVTDEF